jgi:replicative DNA helicase
MGKEELMLSMIDYILFESKSPVLLFSTNHLKSDYIQRLLAIHCDIPTWHLQQGALKPDEWERLDKGVGDLADAPLFLHDSLELSTNELIETARNCIREKGIRIVFVDCLQMIDFDKKWGNASERIEKVMFSLKQLANLSNVPVVVGSMLGRGMEYREGIDGKRPRLMDLMNSSFIEGMADVIMMVHRPEYYHIYQDYDGRKLHGRIEIIVQKNSLKPLGSFFLDYHEKTGVVCPDKSCSNRVSLEDLCSDNEAAIKLIDNFDLEEVFPF